MVSEMSVLIDTGIFIAFHNIKDENHKRATEIIREIIEGKHGSAYTTDYIEELNTHLLLILKYSTAFLSPSSVRSSILNTSPIFRSVTEPQAKAQASREMGFSQTLY
jgi:predicted nucleic acid-binding protein